jgi:hypothetical protein
VCRTGRYDERPRRREGANPSLGVSEKVSAIDAYVRSVEKNISSSQRKELMLSPGELKNVTNENWTKIHTYSDGADLKRIYGCCRVIRRRRRILMGLTQLYEVRPRKDHRGVDLISDVLPFGRARVHRSRHNRF